MGKSQYALLFRVLGYDAVFIHTNTHCDTVPHTSTKNTFCTYEKAA